LSNLKYDTTKKIDTSDQKKIRTTNMTVETIAATCITFATPATFDNEPLTWPLALEDGDKVVMVDRGMI